MGRDFIAEWIETDAEAEKLEAEDEPVGSDVDDRGNEDGE